MRAIVIFTAVLAFYCGIVGLGTYGLFNATLKQIEILRSIETTDRR